MYDFIAIDFETATPDMNSACSLGIACVEKFEIVKTYYFLIQPPNNKYSPYNTEMHGLIAADTASSPDFSGVWPEISSLFNDDCLVVAHNARFDLSVLRACLDLYGLSAGDFKYIDSISVSNRAIKDSSYSKSLIDRAKYFDIPVEHHHNALDDAAVCAKIVIASVKTTNRKSLRTYCSTYMRRITHSFSDLKPMEKFRMPVSRQSKISDITPTSDVKDQSHVFYGKNIVLTGALQSMSRSAAMQKIVDVGGVLKSAVSSKTDYLIVGIQDPDLVGKSGKSTKELKARDLIDRGEDIKILNESEFLAML